MTCVLKAYAGNTGHALVVHAPNGDRIACAVLAASTVSHAVQTCYYKDDKCSANAKAVRGNK